jgi:hypothetical protein
MKRLKLASFLPVAQLCSNLFSRANVSVVGRVNAEDDKERRKSMSMSLSLKIRADSIDYWGEKQKRRGNRDVFVVDEAFSL